MPISHIRFFSRRLSAFWFTEKSDMCEHPYDSLATIVDSRRLDLLRSSMLDRSCTKSQGDQRESMCEHPYDLLRDLLRFQYKFQSFPFCFLVQLYMFKNTCTKQGHQRICSPKYLFLWSLLLASKKKEQIFFFFFL